jgi:hypothetical protein
LSETPHVILTTGPIGRGRLDNAVRRRLSRARIQREDDTVALSERIAHRVSLPREVARAAATRYLGSSESPQALRDGDTVIAADPIYLEPRLDHLCLKAQHDSVDAAELDAIAGHLNATLGDAGSRYERLGGELYLVTANPPATSMHPADAIDDLKPNKFLPSSGDVDGYRRVIAEIEMALHEHAINVSRAERGLPPINSLWLWGASQPARVEPRELPALVSDRPQSVGLWRRYGGDRHPLDALDAVLETHNRIVIDAGDAGTALLPELLARAVSLVVLSRDGYDVTLSPGDRWRFWRRSNRELDG